MIDFVYQTQAPDDLVDECLDYCEARFSSPEDIVVDSSIHRDDLQIMPDRMDKTLRDKLEIFAFGQIDEYQKKYISASSYKKECLMPYGTKLQLTKKHGGFHVWHTEAFANFSLPEELYYEAVSRVYTWTLYLNTITSGGETEFLYQGLKTPAEKGKFIMFPAGLTHFHRGNPPYSSEKYIATGWINVKLFQEQQ